MALFRTISASFIYLCKSRFTFITAAAIALAAVVLLDQQNGLFLPLIILTIPLLIQLKIDVVAVGRKSCTRCKRGILDETARPCTECGGDGMLAADRFQNLHPFILSIYPIIYLLARNPGEAYFDQAMRSLLAFPILAGLAILVFRCTTKHRSIAGMYASLLIVLLLVCGKVLRFCEGNAMPWLEGYSRRMVVASIIVALGLAGSVILIRRLVRAESRLTRIANVLTACLVGVSMLLMGWNAWVEGGSVYISPYRSSHIGQPATLKEPLIRLEPPEGAAPDIYYILLDAYTRSDTLKEFFNHENTEFEDYLKGNGFYIAEKSNSNYLATKFVVPTIMNFSYAEDYLGDLVGSPSKDVRPLYEIAYYNKVVPMMKQLGYRVVQIRSGPEYLSLADTDETIDINASLFKLRGMVIHLNDFEQALMKMFPFKIARSTHRTRVEYAIQNLKNQGKRPGPKFVFAHIFAPHPPFVFGPNGENLHFDMELFMDYSDERVALYAKMYGDQITHLNSLIRGVVDSLLRDSQTPPVIIIQGDHGLRISVTQEPEQSCMKEIYSIFNAYHFPGDTDKTNAVPNETASPVNNFRFIFNRYFGTDLPLLEDRAKFSNRLRPYELIDVTDQMETCAPAWEERFRKTRLNLIADENE